MSKTDRQIDRETDLDGECKEKKASQTVRVEEKRTYIVFVTVNNSSENLSSEQLPNMAMDYTSQEPQRPLSLEF